MGVEATETGVAGKILNGKTAVITGSTSGIGLSIARALAGQGCGIMLNGFGDPAEIQDLCSELETTYGVRVRHHGANLMHPLEIHTMIEWTVAEMGAIDILANNAGIQYTAPVDEYPRDKWDAILAINLTAAFLAIHYALPHMKRNGWGRIINTASVHGLIGSVNKVAYTASKHGLVGLTKVVALETAGSGITCNAICPGFVRTSLVEAQIEARAESAHVDREEAARQMLAEKHPSRQFVPADDVAQLVLFLCSDAAASITGASLPIDGGWTAQ